MKNQDDHLSNLRNHIKLRMQPTLNNYAKLPSSSDDTPAVTVSCSCSYSHTHLLLALYRSTTCSPGLCDYPLNPNIAGLAIKPDYKRSYWTFSDALYMRRGCEPRVPVSQRIPWFPCITALRILVSWFPVYPPSVDTPLVVWQPFFYHLARHPGSHAHNWDVVSKKRELFFTCALKVTRLRLPRGHMHSASWCE